MLPEYFAEPPASKDSTVKLAMHMAHIKDWCTSQQYQRVMQGLTAPLERM